MPQAPIHYLVGMGFGTVISLIVYLIKKDWAKYIPLIITLFGVWAMVPDFPTFANSMVGLNIDLEKAYTHQDSFNIFVFHPEIDHRIGNDYNDYFHVSLIAIAFVYSSVCTLYALRKELG